MTYLLILIALFCLGLKGVCGKKTSCLAQDTSDAVLFNLIRMLLCGLIGFLVVWSEQAQGMLAAEPKMLLICLLAGVGNAMFLVGWILAVQKNTLVMVDVVLTLGSAIPAILCAALFAEPIQISKAAGFFLILLAAGILGKKEKSAEKKSSLAGVALMIAAMVGEGVNSFCQQLYKQFFTEAGSLSGTVFYPKSIYHFYTYVFSALILILALAVCAAAREKKAAAFLSGAKGAASLPGQKAVASLHGQRAASVKAAMAPICIMAVCMFAASWLQTAVTADYGMPSQVLYPVIRGGSLIIINVTGMLFFGEKITLRSAFGSLIALAGIVVLNV